MKSKDKIDLINKKVEILNNTILKNATFKFGFDNNRGANNYCIELKGQYYGFSTYADVLNCIGVIQELFTKEER